MLGNTLFLLLLANLVRAIAFNLKEMCEPTLLQNSIPETKGKSDIYSRIDGRGNSYYFCLSALCSASAGFLFVINNYLPMILCFVCTLLATLLSSKFAEVDTIKSLKKVTLIQNTKIYVKDLKHAFKFIFKSSRLKSLLIMSSLLSSLLFIFILLQNALLAYLGVPAEYFGILHAFALFVSAITSRRQAWFHKTYKNRLLAWFSLPPAIAMLLTGLFVVVGLNIYVIYSAVVLMVLILAIVRGPYFTLINRYYNSFSSPEINTKIYTSKALLECLARAMMFFFASWLLDITSIAYALTIFGFILAALFIFTLEYMKTRLGLKPGEYKSKDIEFRILK